MRQTMNEIESAINLTKGEIDYFIKQGYADRLRDAIDALRKLEKIRTILDVEMKLEVN